MSALAWVTALLRSLAGSQLDLRGRDDARGLAIGDARQPHGANAPALVLQGPRKGWGPNHVPDKPDCSGIEAGGNRDPAILLLGAKRGDSEVVGEGALEPPVHVAHDRAD